MVPALVGRDVELAQAAAALAAAEHREVGALIIRRRAGNREVIPEGAGPVNPLLLR
jgi:hypothetical protein